MKKINLKKNIIVVFVVTIIILSLGFIFVSLKYNELLTKDNTFNFEFTKVKKINSIKGSSKEPKGNIEIIKNSKILDMSFNMFNPNDEIVYEITIKNTGNNSIEINNLIMSPDYINDSKKEITPVEMTITEIEKKILEPNEDIIVKLKVVYKAGASLGEKLIKGKIGIIASKQ